MARHVACIQDFFTTMCCGSHQKVPFECFKVFLICEDCILGYLSFDTFLEVHKVLSIGIGIWFGWSSLSDRGHVAMLNVELMSLLVINSLQVFLQNILWKEDKTASPDIDCASITRGWMYFQNISRFLVGLVLRYSRVVLFHGTSR